MDYCWDADFRDCEFSVNSKVQDHSNHKVPEMAVPDLSTLTDEEFMERIAAMKREHQRTMELCDNLGLQPAQTSEFSPQSPSVPVAFVNNNYTLSTMNYSSPAGDLITSSRCVRRPFKARRAPPRRKVEPHTIERRSGSKKKEASNLNEEEQMKMYLMERYLNTYDDNDAIWSDFQDDFSRGPVAGRPAPRLVSFDDSWHPGVTVPKPFSMTVRESLKPRVLSRSMADFERQRDEQANKEHQECNKKFKAAPAPAHIYVPLFEQLSSDRERRRHMNHARRQAELEQLQKPFAFLRREEERQANRQQRQAAFAVADSGVPDANFKAKPFPDHIFNNDAYERIKQQEEIRQEQRLNRAEAMLQLSSLPPNMLKKRPSHCCDMSHESDEERGRSPTRGACETRYDVTCMSPTRCHDRPAEDSSQSLRVKSRTIKESHSGRNTPERWPRHNVGGNPLSRSLSDLLPASEVDDCLFGVQGRPIGKRSMASSVASQRSVAVKSACARPVAKCASPVNGRPPVPRSYQSAAAAAAQSRKWRPAESTMEARLRREIEEDLKSIDLTAN